jgi:hypothetical protein
MYMCTFNICFCPPWYVSSVLLRLPMGGEFRIMICLQPETQSRRNFDLNNILSTIVNNSFMAQGAMRYCPCQTLATSWPPVSQLGLSNGSPADGRDPRQVHLYCPIDFP